jgi:hypothetical protein
LIQDYLKDKADRKKRDFEEVRRKLGHHIRMFFVVSLHFRLLSFFYEILMSIYGMPSDLTS